MSDVKRWLAVYAGEGVVHLFPVDPPSCGPDVFVKLADYDAKCGEVAALEAKLAEAERDAGRLREAARAVVNADCRFRNDDGDARSTAEERFDAMKKLAALAAQEKPCRYCIKERQP